MTPGEALDRLPEIAGAEVESELHCGPASNSYLLRRNREQFVLRVDRPLAALLGLDRRAEPEILRPVAAAGIGPELVVARPEDGLLVTRYIPGKSWSEADLREPANLKRLAGILNRVHALRPIGPHLGLRTAVSRYASLIGTPEADELAAEAATLLRRLTADDIPQCLCHNDPIAPNVIDGEGLRLIDWEYAAIGDPFFELAVITQHHELTEQEIDILLTTLLGRVTESHHHHLHRTRALYDRVSLLWLLVVQAASPMDETQQAQLKLTRDRVSRQPLP